MRGVRYFDLSDPKRPREITPAGAPTDYVGKHRQAGISEADVPVEADVDDVTDHGHDRKNGVGRSHAGKDATHRARRTG